MLVGLDCITVLMGWKQVGIFRGFFFVDSKINSIFARESSNKTSKNKKLLIWQQSI